MFQFFVENKTIKIFSNNYSSKAIRMKPVTFLLLFITSASAVLPGVDISFVEFFETRGAIYRDEQGQPKDLFKLMKYNSIDIIRLRLFTSNEEQAQRDPYNYGNTLNLTLRLARRIKANGLQFMLDYHYSDTWADPGKQRKPSAWAHLTFEQLTNTLYNYTRDSLRAFVEQDTIPQYIQIGNEVTNRMLWPDGYPGPNNNWTNFITLLNAASQGMRVVLKDQTKIVIHTTYSTDWPGGKHFYDHMIGNVDFDIIGLSYYPFWHGNLIQLSSGLEQYSLNYDKQIFIVETDYRWKEDPYVNDSMKNKTGFDETPEGQMMFAEYIAKLLNNLPGKKRETGLFWWATEYLATKNYTNLGGFDLKSFFNTSGIALPIVRNFGKSEGSELGMGRIALVPPKAMDPLL
jgi:arabinogalactan endo-1,4-beta-galactosidase